MAQFTIEQAFALALQHHQNGRLGDAERVYRQILAQQPNHANALHFLGLIAVQMGRNDVAVELIRQAIAVKPDYAEAHGNLGVALQNHGQADQAIAAYRQAIALKPDYADAHGNLGNALKGKGQFDEAIAAWRRAIAIKPNSPETHANLGNTLRDKGRLDEAITAYRQAIAFRPGLAEAHGNLGLALKDMGRIDDAVAAWRQAIALKPDYPEAHANLGLALAGKGRFDEAIIAWRRAIALKPNSSEAFNNLGLALKEMGRLDDAIAAFRQAIGVNPNYAEAHSNLGIALGTQGQLDEAIAAFRQAIAVMANCPEAYSNLGDALKDKGNIDEAIAACRQAIALRPDFAEAHSNLGNALRAKGRLDEAIAAYRQAIAFKPGFSAAHNNLGVGLKDTGLLDDAIVCFRAAIALQPDYSDAYNNLGAALKDKGQLDQAIAAYDKAIVLKPHSHNADSNRVYTLYFRPGYDPAIILKEHRLWNDRHARRYLAEVLPHENDSRPDRRLKIGYVSPDFRDHCQAMFTLGLLANHDRNRFEIHCYSDVFAPDSTTERLRGYCDSWRNIVGMSDAQAAELIRRDKIDILVDLTVHMANHRLLAFARKPAPVQATWLGYPGTTGLETMDYRLSDPYLDPPINDGFYTEQTIRLANTFWCYDPLTTDLAPNEPPFIENGFITFGCLNNFCKVNDGALRRWAGVMRATPNARLVLLAPEGDARRQVIDLMENESIESFRIDFVARQPRRRYLETFHRIDICLDTFPYNGHTTSLDSFWMGVPVVTQIGVTAVSRGGWSQLCNLGLTELAGDCDGSFVTVAVKLAADVDRLRGLRATLRGRMTASPLMDAPRFARNLETAYRQMWRTWSAKARNNLS